jgi:hypothetical protein
MLLVAAAFSLPAQNKGCDGSTVEDYDRKLAPKAREFLHRLQEAVRAADRHRIAAMVHYPLLVNRSGGRRSVRTAPQFEREYDSIFTAGVRKAIEEQTPACLFANYQGVTIGGGEVWYDEQPDGSLKIKTVNLP